MVERREKNEDQEARGEEGGGGDRESSSARSESGEKCVTCVSHELIVVCLPRVA